MLETLISSKIRRALLEYVLTHSSDRFYLRGLAKELHLPISPLRRELKRLQQAGMLSAVQEANILFYTVNTTSSVFLQLQHAGMPAAAPALAGRQAEAPSFVQIAEGSRQLPPSSRLDAEAQPAFSLPPSRHSLQPPTLRLTWRSLVKSPVLIGAAGVGMALVVIAASLIYVTMTNQQLVSNISRTLTARKTEVTVVTSPSASNTMHGSRWQIVPGGFGGFSSGANSGESY